MSRQSESPAGRTRWEPEPLRIPVAPWRPGMPGARDHEAGRDPDRDDELPGSHVIVIDLA